MKLKALTLYQPHASLIALGVKPIETRGWSTKYRGPLAIHAAAKPIGTGALYIGDGRTGWTNVTGEPIANGEQAMSGGIDRLLVCPLGAIVASCELVDVVPMVDAEDYERRYDGGYEGPAALLITDRWLGLVPEWGGALDEDEVVTADDQLPYGDFAPGRFAWMLDDIKPTTERCPWCWGALIVGCPADCDGRPHSTWCPTCNGAGHCDPIPAKGRQGLWSWEP